MLIFVFAFVIEECFCLRHSLTKLRPICATTFEHLHKCLTWTQLETFTVNSLLLTLANSRWQTQVYINILSSKDDNLALATSPRRSVQIKVSFFNSVYRELNKIASGTDGLTLIVTSHVKHSVWTCRRIFKVRVWQGYVHNIQKK